VIINGDFWDGYITTFDKFVKSKWKKLFPMLRSKKTVYIYGNHDSKKLSDVRVKLFSVFQGYNYEFKSGKVNLAIEHGHKIIPVFDEMIPKIVLNIIALIHRTVRRLQYRFNPGSLLSYYKRLNRYYRSHANNLNNQILVVGHTYGASLNLDERIVNSGFIQWGYGSYLIIENGKITLQIEDY